MMHTVALRNETALSDGRTPANPGHAFQVFGYSSEWIFNLLIRNHGRLVPLICNFFIHFQGRR